MPIYRGTIFTEVENHGQQWRNVYNLNAPNSLEAIDILNAIEGYQLTVTNVHCYVVRLHVVNITNKNDVRSESVSDQGHIADISGADALPLFCTVEVTFTDALKRPERKWIRGWFQTANVENGHWSGELTDFVNTNYAQPVLAEAGYVGPGGEHPSGVGVSQSIANRQLGWHRRHRPGFKRGWVAV